MDRAIQELPGGLDERSLLALLRDRGTPPTLLSQIGRHERWSRLHSVRRALVLHPQTPLALSRNLIPYLFWKDLCDVAAGPAVNPVARKQAERQLLRRLDELSLGERVALARRATRGLLARLATDSESAVLTALLGNPRLYEADCVRLAEAPGTPPDVLRRIAVDARWCGRRSVRFALIRNPGTPADAALRLLQRLSRADLRSLAVSDTVPPVIRVAVQRRLGAGAPGNDGQV